MKIFVVLGMMLLGILRASAQLTVELTLDQEQFLPGESLPVAVKITNRSGQPVHLGADPTWLTFSIESADGFVVMKLNEVPVLGEFDVESSQMATKHVDLQPSFSLVRSGRYKVIATLHVKEWGFTLASDPKNFDIVNGVELWSQEFGVAGTGGIPEMRKYTLQQANYLRSQIRLYVSVSDTDKTRVFKAAALGPMVSFSHPEAQVDRYSQLHVLWQTSAQGFNYYIVSPEGSILSHDTYDYYANGSRPRLSVDTTGAVVVLGGTLRVRSEDIPLVKPPNTLPSRPVKQ
jgi:hypothetical protein